MMKNDLRTVRAADLTEAQVRTLEEIRVAGGSVSRTYLGGWQGNVRLGLDIVEELVALGILTVTHTDAIGYRKLADEAVRKSGRSRGISSQVTTYRLAKVKIVTEVA